MKNSPKKITAEKVVDRVAYARNGNAHRPTVYYKWIGRVDGKIVTGMLRTKREALAVAEEAAKE